MEEIEKPYWSMEIDDVLSDFEVDPSVGLSEEQISERSRIYGINSPFSTPESVTPEMILKRFVLFSFFFIILSIVIFLAIFIPTWLICGIYSIAGDNGLTLTIITLLAIILVKIYQIPLVFRMKKNLKPWLEEKLRAISSEEPKSMVYRDGKEQDVPHSEIVPGDIIILKLENPKIPADARLLESEGLEIFETLLTGSSTPTKKDAFKVVPNDTAFWERSNMICALTEIARGSGKALGVTTGKNMEIPKISVSLNAPPEIGPIPKYPYLKIPKIMSLCLWIFFLIVMILSWVSC